ncbi:EGF-like domain-containing protein [Cavenderia fasciculata]|uniref:EGF-like domain-containing protein n=1 Tax=Cavenderia fasciculata TaxID=261658 RepID=F4QFP7_CACFS|nr:EGF-like domain-containing protein [Cavenderia fasciculata]EGG13500.1 EGF-like domain-containing protein [Cavenderia fasciculata]|eukprot:XP_004350204.1 EGF-like domain-containing protein [Cavenderia fasciculata]
MNSKSNWYLVIMTLLLCCHYHISLSNAQQQQQILPDDELQSAIFLIQQYGIPVPKNQSLCEPNTRFVCNNDTFDGRYRIVEINFNIYTRTDGGSPSSTLTSLTLPALKRVVNRSINLLELFKSVKSLNSIYFGNDASISYLPSDFNNFPHLTSFQLTLNQPLIVPLTFLNNSINLQSIDIQFPIQSITIDDSLYFPSLTSYTFQSNCTYGSHHINVTSKSFPRIDKFVINTLHGSNTTVYFNLDPSGTVKKKISITGRQSTILPSPISRDASLGIGDNSIQNFTTNLPDTLRSLVIENNANFKGPITESFCVLTFLDIRGTAVSSLPACFWCYQGLFLNIYLPADFVKPVGFTSCPITNKNIATITGTNIGYGSIQSQYYINSIIPNQKLIFNYTDVVTPVPSIPTLITINFNPHTVQMMIVKGYNPYFNHTVTINNITACTNITNIASNQFQCTTPLLSSGDHQLIVSNSYVESQVPFTFYSLAYLCQQSTNNCHGNGKCNIDGICICNSNSFYNNCSKHINTTITPNTTDPTLAFDIDGLDFLFEIVSIQELDLDDIIIKELFISNYTWNVNASTNNHTTIINYQLNTSSSSSTYQPAQVLSTISFSTLARTVEFGGQQLLINANSIKLEVNISKWQYSSNLSTLRVVFKTLINNNQSIQYDCIDKDISTFSYDSLSSLQYLRVVKDGIQFNGRFIDVAMSDGRPTYSPTQLISSTPINDEQSIVKIGILFPQCQECILDPDFSALIINPDDSGKCDSVSLSDIKWKIIMIVVCVSFVVVSSIVVIVIALKKRAQSKKFKENLQKRFYQYGFNPIVPTTDHSKTS